MPVRHPLVKKKSASQGLPRSWACRSRRSSTILVRPHLATQPSHGRGLDSGHPPRASTAGRPAARVWAVCGTTRERSGGDRPRSWKGAGQTNDDQEALHTAGSPAWFSRMESSTPGACVAYGTLVLETQRGSAVNIFVISTELGVPKGPYAASAARTTVLRLFGITKAGLAAMAISVLALWCCIALESTTRHRAAMDARASFQTLERLRQQSVPAAEPRTPFHSQSVRSS